MSADDYTVEEVLEYHEAGHAIVAWAFCKPVLSISINGIRGAVRDAMCWQAPEDMNLGDVDLHGKILLGGEMAERILYQDNFDSLQLMSGEDRAKLEVLA